MTKEDKMDYILDFMQYAMEEPPCMWLEEQDFSCPYLNKCGRCTYPTEDYNCECQKSFRKWLTSDN